MPAVVKVLSVGRVGGVLFDVGALGLSAGAVSPRASNSGRAHQDPPAPGRRFSVCVWLVYESERGAGFLPLLYIRFAAY